MALRKLAVGAFKNQNIILLNERHLFKRALGALSALPRLAMEQLTVFFVTRFLQLLPVTLHPFARGIFHIHFERAAGPADHNQRVPAEPFLPWPVVEIL